MFEASRPAAVAVECDLHEGLGVHADPGQLRQVLWNLLVNAAQAMPEGGAVRIEARPARRRAPQDDGTAGRMDEEKPVWAEIAVMDQGVGIPRELVDRVFDPFFTTKAGGTGLGLAIVHRVIAEHRGVVRVERRPGGVPHRDPPLAAARRAARRERARTRARRRRRAEHAGVPRDLPAQRGLRRGGGRRRGRRRAPSSSTTTSTS